MATKKQAPKAQKVPKYVEPGSMLNPPKGYKRNTENMPDPKKVKAYYSKKK